MFLWQSPASSRQSTPPLGNGAVTLGLLQRAQAWTTVSQYDGIPQGTVVATPSTGQSYFTASTMDIWVLKHEISKLTLQQTSHIRHVVQQMSPGRDLPEWWELRGSTRDIDLGQRINRAHLDHHSSRKGNLQSRLRSFWMLAEPWVKVRGRGGEVPVGRLVCTPFSDIGGLHQGSYYAETNFDLWIVLQHLHPNRARRHSTKWRKQVNVNDVFPSKSSPLFCHVDQIDFANVNQADQRMILLTLRQKAAGAASVPIHGIQHSSRTITSKGRTFQVFKRGTRTEQQCDEMWIQAELWNVALASRLNFVAKGTLIILAIWGEPTDATWKEDDKDTWDTFQLNLRSKVPDRYGIWQARQDLHGVDGRGIILPMTNPALWRHMDVRNSKEIAIGTQTVRNFVDRQKGPKLTERLAATKHLHRDASPKRSRVQTPAKAAYRSYPASPALSHASFASKSTGRNSQSPRSSASSISRTSTPSFW